MLHYITARASGRQISCEKPSETVRAQCYKTGWNVALKGNDPWPWVHEEVFWESSLNCWFTLDIPQLLPRSLGLSLFTWKCLTASCYVFRKHTHRPSLAPFIPHLPAAFVSDSLFIKSIRIILLNRYSVACTCSTINYVLHSYHITSHKPICSTVTMLTDLTSRSKVERLCLAFLQVLHLHPVGMKLQPFHQRVLGNLRGAHCLSLVSSNLQTL